jgi:hypothetical protein
MKFVFGSLQLLLVKYAVLTQKYINPTTNIHKSNRVMKTSIVILFRLWLITENKRVLVCAATAQLGRWPSHCSGFYITRS